MFDLRLARLDELDNVADVWHESASKMDGAPEKMPSRYELRERIGKEISSGWDLYVAERHRRVVGILALKPTTATLEQIFVLPAEQGRGVGRAFLNLTKQMLPGGFTLRAAVSNSHARHFYEREGLRLTKIGGHPRTGASVCFYEWTVREGSIPTSAGGTP